MGQESVNLMATPKVSHPDGAEVRKSSTGKQYPSRSAQNMSLIRPTSSCHDFCKYGRKHEFEAKARSPAQKKGTAPKNSNQSSPRSVIVTERKPMEVGKVTPRSHFESSFDSRIARHGVSSLVKSVEVPITAFSKTAVPLKPKSVTRMPPSVAKSAGGLTITKYSDISRGEATQTQWIDKKPSAPTKVPLPLENARSRVLATPKHSIQKVAPRTVITNIEPKQLSGDKNEEKKVHAFLRAARPLKPSPIGVASLNPREKKSLEVAAPLKKKKAMGETESNQVGKDKKNKETSGGMKNLEAVCPLKIQNSHVESLDSYNGKSPLQAVIEAKTAEEAFGYSRDGILPFEPAVSISLSTKSSSSDSSYPFMSTPDEEELQDFEYSSEADGCTSEDGTADLNTVKSTMEPEDSSVYRNARMPLSMEEGSASTKMMFRRGKIIEHKPEDEGPRRLKFRQGRLLEGNHKVGGHDRQKRFERRGSADCPANGNAGSEEVVLRRREGQGKKDEQVLLNNVIEEIASRLEQTRKSKVKALVGAFESVISLQENHSSTGIVNL